MVEEDTGRNKITIGVIYDLLILIIQVREFLLIGEDAMVTIAISLGGGPNNNNNKDVKQVCLPRCHSLSFRDHIVV